MSVKEGRDYLYLIWKDPKQRKNYVVGELSKNGQYEFAYSNGVKEAMENGFELLISFENINKVYKSDILFPTFSSRLPDRKRRGIEDILAKYDLDKFDEYKLLKRSGARLPIDNLEFIDPIFEYSDEAIEREFHVAGVRYYIGCEGECCEEAQTMKENEKLKLEPDPLNKYDENAIKILNEENDLIGYVPRYYNESILKFLNRKRDYLCTVIEVIKDKKCNECVKVRLEIKPQEKTDG